MLVRHSEIKDIEQIHQLYSEPSAYSNTLQAPHPSLEKWKAFLGKHTEGFYSLVAVDGETVLGQLGMEVFSNPRRKHVAKIGMAVFNQHQGKSVGSKLVEEAINLATKWLGIRRIELEVYTDNEAAIALYRKFGFEVEGQAKGYAFKDGSYVDVLLMAYTIGM